MSTFVPTERFVIFRLSGQLLAVTLEHVRELVPLPRLSRPPGQPTIIEGFLHLDGVAVTVLRLDRLLALPESGPGLYTPVLILTHSGGTIAWLVDEVQAIVDGAPGNRIALPSDRSFNGCAEAELTFEDGRTASLLAPDRILLAQEQRRVTEFQAREQRRLRDLEAASSAP